MRFLNTLRNKLTRRKKKPRRSRRRRKPRMSRLRSFLNRNRNRLRTRKNVGRMPHSTKSKTSAFSAFKRPSTLKKCSIKPQQSNKPQMSVEELEKLFAKSNVKPKTSKQFKPKLIRSPTSRNLTNLQTSKQVQELKNLIKRIEKDQNLKGGKRRKSKRKNKRKY